MWVILRGQEYVAREGSAKSYTRSLEDARKFASKDEADRHRCGNETAHSVDWILGKI